MDLSRETVEGIAKRLDMTLCDLRALAHKAPSLYKSWKEPKKSGVGFRAIEAPYENLKAIQRLLLDKVFNKMSVNPMLFGGKGSSPKKAVIRHTNKPLVITMDIMDFFPSVKAYMVRDVLRKRGANLEVAKLLTRLLTYKNHVPHGAPTSSCITRIVLHPVAGHIERLMNSMGHESNASLYVDDLIISGPSGLTRLQKTIVDIFNRYNFSIHTSPSKIRVMYQDEEQVALGVKLNHGIAVPATYYNKYNEKVKELGDTHKTIKGMRSYMHSLKV